jgi:peptidoglycan/LPS O-acetylase OafA/YrhL
MGALVALLLNCKWSNIKTDKIFGSKISILVALLFIFNEPITAENNYYISQYIRGVGFAVLIGWIVLNQKSKLTYALEISPLNYLGKISYGIYMYQGFFLATGPYRAANQTWPPDQSLGVILLIIIAPLSYHFFEKPMINLKHKLQRDVNYGTNKPIQRVAD